MYKIGERVQTIDGPGVVAGYEGTQNTKPFRHCVDLDVPKYSFAPYYFDYEIKAIEPDNAVDVKHENIK